MRLVPVPVILFLLFHLPVALSAQTDFAAHADSVARADALTHAAARAKTDSLARIDSFLHVARPRKKSGRQEAGPVAPGPSVAVPPAVAAVTDDTGEASGLPVADSAKTAVRPESYWKKYRVQPGHSYAINTRAMLSRKKKANLEYNLADFYLYRNGVLVKPPQHASIDFFPAGCLCFKYDDTLLLNSGLGKTVGVGVGIKIHEGKFTGTLHANLREEAVYKISRNDSVYLHSLTREPESQSLKLSRAPAFMPNEVITGEYEATYKSFYEKDIHQKDELRSYTVRIVFRCRVTGGIDSMKSLKSLSRK